MKTITVANPRAAEGKVGHERARYERLIADIFGPNEMQFTESPGDATRLVREAVDHGYERIVVVGGDGKVLVIDHEGKLVATIPTDAARFKRKSDVQVEGFAANALMVWYAPVIFWSNFLNTSSSDQK